MRLRMLTLLFVMTAPLPAMSDSMRCGQWIVDERSSVAELIEKCGAPQGKDRRTEDVMAINPAGHPVKTGTTTTEYWYYQRSSRSLPMVVMIVDGNLKSIERRE